MWSGTAASIVMFSPITGCKTAIKRGKSARLPDGLCSMFPSIIQMTREPSLPIFKTESGNVEYRCLKMLTTLQACTTALSSFSRRVRYLVPFRSFWRPSHGKQDLLPRVRIFHQAAQRKAEIWGKKNGDIIWMVMTSVLTEVPSGPDWWQSINNWRSILSNADRGWPIRRRFILG